MKEPQSELQSSNRMEDCLASNKDTVFSCLVSIQEEIRHLLQTLAETDGEPVFIRKYTVASLSNVITQLLFDVRYARDHPVRLKLDDLFAKAGAALSTGSVVVLLPSWVYKIAGMTPFTRIHALKTSFGGLYKFIK